MSKHKRIIVSRYNNCENYIQISKDCQTDFASNTNAITIPKSSDSNCNDEINYCDVDGTSSSNTKFDTSCYFRSRFYNSERFKDRSIKQSLGRPYTGLCLNAKSNLNDCNEGNIDKCLFIRSAVLLLLL